MANDRNSIGGQVMRYARVGRSVGGLAAKLAGERYLGMEIDRLQVSRQVSDGTIFFLPLLQKKKDVLTSAISGRKQFYLRVILIKLYGRNALFLQQNKYL